MSNSLIDPADSLTAAVPSEEAPVEGGAFVNGTFAGDNGQLPLETRRVLVQLLLGPSIDATRQRHLWPVLLRDEAVLRSRLHDLFLELVVDTDHNVHTPRLIRESATSHAGRRGRRARRRVV